MIIKRSLKQILPKLDSVWEISISPPMQNDEIHNKNPYVEMSRFESKIRIFSKNIDQKYFFDLRSTMSIQNFA